MSLTHKSQSALEYMMTYGWAILIIVIVAAVLYSLGIFSPSSSITSSVTGFSNLGSVIAQVIPNSGLMLSLGDSAGYNINITNITISLNGKTSTIEPNTLISSSSSSKFFIPFSSVSASSSYSFAVTVHYTEPGQALPGPYISKGTVYGTATGSSGFYQSITITNSQTTPTPAPFQQMINLSISNGDWYTVTNMIASNYQNVEFFSSNGTIIPSWLENYSSSQFIYWIKLQNGIPASSSVTIYMVYFPKSDSVLNSVNDGEAPQIPCGSTPTSSCSNYGEYDDGADVFNFYSDFKGTSLNTNKWINGGTGTNCGGTVVIGGGPGVIINNGLSISTDSSTYWGGIVSSTGFIPPIIFETDTISLGGVASGIAEATANNLNAGMYFFNFWNSGFASGVIDEGLNNLAPPLISTGVTGIAWLSSSSQVVYHNYIATQESQTFYSLPSTVYPIIGIGDCSASSGISVQWARVRAYPPNGVMPSVSFGSVS